ncbi:uncharacterized protein LOC125946822 [Dermacentor silvarum]|uniref:uncharacterized protein LOC125946822 n=1 Tax=Dermacentor silvarum TaxID=543639 RepID=UPI00210155BD|nr:uncharacterized protein LOC125946822 [Dermacentor silvarum]
MKYFCVGLTVCLFGIVADADSWLPASRNLRQISERDRGGQCGRAMVKGKNACNRSLSVFRSHYGFNAATKKCEKYKNCSLIVGKEYHRRKDCYEECDSDSKCLDTMYSEYHELYPPGTKPMWYYYYDPDYDVCVEIETLLDASDFWPKGNVFRTESRCKRHCAPNHRTRKS